MKKLLLALLLFPSLALAQTWEKSNLWERAANGNLRGISYLRFSGYNPANTTSFEPFWGESAAYTVGTAALSSPYCASTSASDDAGSTGCEEIVVTGTTTSYAAFSETLVMDGQTSVTLTTSNVYFINSIRCTGAGSGTVNAGVIACGTGANSSGDPAVIHQLMLTGQGVSQSAMYVVPANNTMICRDFSSSVYSVTASSLYRIVMDFYEDPIADLVLNRVELQNITAPSGGSGISVSGDSMMKFPEKTVVIPQVLASTGAGPITFTAECLVIDNSTGAQNFF